MNEIDVINDILKKNETVLTSKMIEQFEKYYNFLIEYNNLVNLTTITEKKDVYIKHFADCLLNLSKYKHGATICDIGTGAGFPGVVLKIVRPDLKVTLVDSLNKRIIFLNKLLSLIDINDVMVIHARAEDGDFKKKYLNSFDYVVARAVAPLVTLAEYCIPFVKIGGYFVAYKGDNLQEELCGSKNAIKKLGGEIYNIDKFDLTDNQRNILYIKKISLTSNTYPRDLNKPRLKPLL